MEVFAERFGSAQDQISQELEQVLDPFGGRLNEWTCEFAGIVCAVHVFFLCFELG